MQFFNEKLSFLTKFNWALILLFFLWFPSTVNASPTSECRNLAKRFSEEKQLTSYELASLIKCVNDETDISISNKNKNSVYDKSLPKFKNYDEIKDKQKIQNSVK